MWNMSLFNFELRVLPATFFKKFQNNLSQRSWCVGSIFATTGLTSWCVLPPAYHRWCALVHRQ
jgi:hypothetical protein